MPLPFNPESPRYRCCCCHSKTGTIILAVLDALLSLAQAMQIIGLHIKTGGDENGLMHNSSVYHLTVVFVVFLASLMALFGIYKERIKYMVLYFFWRLIVIGLVLGLEIILLKSLAWRADLWMLDLLGKLSGRNFGAAGGDDQSREDAQRALNVILTALIIVGCVAFAVCIWLLFLIIWCMRFIYDKNQQKPPEEKVSGILSTPITAVMEEDGLFTMPDSQDSTPAATTSGANRKGVGSSAASSSTTATTSRNTRANSKRPVANTSSSSTKSSGSKRPTASYKKNSRELETTDPLPDRSIYHGFQQKLHGKNQQRV